MDLTNFSSYDLTNYINQLLEDKKADNIVTLDVTGKTAISDYMIIATGQSSRQVAALADYLSYELKQKGLIIHTEGMEQCEWVLLDAGDVLVHIFKPEMRQFYDLEKMWNTPNPISKISIG